MSSNADSWYVLCTKPRNEKKVAERLSTDGYNVYCPLHKVKRQWSDRMKVVEEPLFKGYLFIQVGDKRRDEVFNHSGAVRYLFWLRRPALVSSCEIHTIKKNCWGSTITRIWISQRSCVAILYASPLANSLAKTLFCWIAAPERPSFS
jgi:transcription antitermination factor NusG